MPGRCELMDAALSHAGTPRDLPCVEAEPSLDFGIRQHALCA
jgi:hypothetical protein